MCVTIANSLMAETIIMLHRVVIDGVHYHILGYQCTVQNLSTGPNAMILHIPSRTEMSHKNLLETSHAPSILKNISQAIPKILTRGMSDNGPKDLGRVTIFEHGIYAVVSTQDPYLAYDALQLVPVNKRPNISRSFLEYYAKARPGWTLQICCFDNSEAGTAAPLLWKFEPIDPDTYTFPMLDAHDGGVPRNGVDVHRDHVLAIGCNDYQFGERVSYSEHLGDLALVLPQYVYGKRKNGRSPNGDYTVSQASINSRRFDLQLLPA